MVLVDPELAQTPERHPKSTLTGTSASLGILMGHVFRRSSGRAWRLRRRSMELWPQWADALHTPDAPVALHTALVQLAASDQEADLQRHLAEQRSALGLQFLPPDTLQNAHPDWPNCRYGGLLSAQDGRVDPLLLQQALRQQLQQLNVALKATRVEHLQRSQRGWVLQLANGSQVTARQVVVCSALASQALLAPLGHERPMEPVLGQVLQLQLASAEALGSQWPAVLVSHGVNLVRHGADQLWLGATLEPGTDPDAAAAAALKTLEGDAPRWLGECKEVGRWHGLRARPSGRPAPLLEVLEPGLILATGHYRNGVLLAPATAEWVSEQINAGDHQKRMLTEP